ncbi:small integral membrane protein 20 [Zeugodacus cucurbitae]|uniref:small integral membrane protein 20 n=1 Tax=Zeugodacus cucurbitae TaxID=28588 RepID=UPI0005968D74|nr:small integral membrane protein 20 [Zeugodacus cucurbitae]
MVFLRGWRYAAFISCIVGGISVALYPIIVEPMMNVEKYKELQKHNRAGIRQEEIQPGNMKVWSDPFGRK